MDEVVFPVAVASMVIGSADTHLNELLTKYCEEALAHRAPARATLRSSVENAMAPLLPHGQANAVEIARRIGMSHRTLARRLAAEGLTFSEIAEELKGDLARHYLRDGDLPISQIAWLLGYREVSALHPRLQAMDWNDAKTGTGAKSSRDCRHCPESPAWPAESRPIAGRSNVPAQSSPPYTTSAGASLQTSLPASICSVA